MFFLEEDCLKIIGPRVKLYHKAVIFQNGSLNLNATNSSLYLINIELEFETTSLDGLILVDNGFRFQMIVNCFLIKKYLKIY